MSIVVFLTLALAIWHFTVFLPDRFYGGIIGALFASILGGLFSGASLQILFYGSLSETSALTLALPLPWIVIFLVVFYLYGNSETNFGRRYFSGV